MDNPVSAFEQSCVKQLVERLRSFLLSEFSKTLQFHGLHSSVLATFRTAVLDNTILTTFLVKLLPCKEKVETDLIKKKKNLREHAKVFGIPLGLRVSLVERSAEMVSNWHSWSVIEGGFELGAIRRKSGDDGGESERLGNIAKESSSDAMYGSVNVKLEHTAVLLGKCLSTCQALLGGNEAVLQTFEVFCPAWSTYPLTLLVYNPQNLSPTSFSLSTHQKTESSNRSVQSFLCLCLQWIKCHSSNIKHPYSIRHVVKVYFLQYIRHCWCLVIAPNHVSNSSLLLHNSRFNINSNPSITASMFEMMPSCRAHFLGRDDLSSLTFTVTLDEFLRQGLLTPTTSSASSQSSSRLLTLNLILAVCHCLEVWHLHDPPFSHQQDDTQKQTETGRDSRSNPSFSQPPGLLSPHTPFTGRNGHENDTTQRRGMENNVCGETLYLSLQHFMVTYSTPAPCNSSTNNSGISSCSNCISSSADECNSGISLLRCELHPLPPLTPCARDSESLLDSLGERGSGRVTSPMDSFQTTPQKHTLAGVPSHAQPVAQLTHLLPPELFHPHDTPPPPPSSPSMSRTVEYFPVTSHGRNLSDVTTGLSFPSSSSISSSSFSSEHDNDNSLAFHVADDTETEGSYNTNSQFEGTTNIHTIAESVFHTGYTLNMGGSGGMEVDDTDESVGLGIDLDYVSSRSSSCSNIPSPASTISSTQLSPNGMDTPHPPPELSHLYSLALIICCILKGRAFTPKEMGEFRQAHEHYYNDIYHLRLLKELQHQHQQKKHRSQPAPQETINVPSYYTPNVEHLVQTTMLDSHLWPSSLRSLPSDQTLRDMLAQKSQHPQTKHKSQCQSELQSQSQSFLSDAFLGLEKGYLTTLLEVTALLKQCLRFMPWSRVEGEGCVSDEEGAGKSGGEAGSRGMVVLRQLAELVHRLKNMVESEEAGQEKHQVIRHTPTSGLMQGQMQKQMAMYSMHTGFSQDTDHNTDYESDRAGVSTLSSSYASDRSFDDPLPSVLLDSVSHDQSVQIPHACGPPRCICFPSPNVSSHFFIGLAMLHRYAPREYAIIVPSARSDGCLSMLVSGFQQIYQQQLSGSSLSSLKALWNYLLVLWMSGVLRPAQFIQLLTSHQAQHPALPLATYIQLYRQFHLVCEGDIELKRMFFIPKNCSECDNRSDSTECERENRPPGTDTATDTAGYSGFNRDSCEPWSQAYMCQGLAPVEALGIQSLTMFVTDACPDIAFPTYVEGKLSTSGCSIINAGTNSARNNNSTLRVSIDSKISHFTATYTPSPTTAAAIAHPGSAAASCLHYNVKSTHVSKSTLFREAVCCVNPIAHITPSTGSGSTASVRAIWLSLNAEMNGITVEEYTCDSSLLLSVGEVLDVPVGDTCANGGVDVASLFVDKLMWCTTLEGGAGAKGDVSHVSSSVSSQVSPIDNITTTVTTTTQPLVLLLRGRWLYEEEGRYSNLHHCPNASNEDDSDVDTVTFDEFEQQQQQQQQEYGHDSESEFSESATTPAPLYMPYFLLVMDLITSETFSSQGGGESCMEMQMEVDKNTHHVAIRDVYLLQHLHHDQVPLCLTSIPVITSTRDNVNSSRDGSGENKVAAMSLVVNGSGGLLGIISLPLPPSLTRPHLSSGTHPISTASTTSATPFVPSVGSTKFLFVMHLNSDRFIHSMTSERDNRNNNRTTLPLTPLHLSPSGIQGIHSSDTVVTAVSYCAFPSSPASSPPLPQFGNHPAAFNTGSNADSSCAGVLVTGDADGRVCLWGVRLTSLTSTHRQRRRHDDGSRDNNDGSLSMSVSLLTPTTLQLDGSIDQLHFAPPTIAPPLTGMGCVLGGDVLLQPLQIVVTTDIRCYLLSSDITGVASLPPMAYKEAGRSNRSGAVSPPTLFVKAVLDCGYKYSEAHTAAYGYSLCPRYLVAFQPESVLLWRVMRGGGGEGGKVTDIVIAHRVVKLKQEALPSFLLDSVCPEVPHGAFVTTASTIFPSVHVSMPLSQSTASEATWLSQQPRQNDTNTEVIQKLCQLIVIAHYREAYELLLDHNPNRPIIPGARVFVLAPLEFVAWQTILADLVSFSTTKSSSPLSSQSQSIVSLQLIDHHALDVHLLHIHQLLAIAHNKSEVIHAYREEDSERDKGRDMGSSERGNIDKDVHQQRQARLLQLQAQTRHDRTWASVPVTASVSLNVPSYGSTSGPNTAGRGGSGSGAGCNRSSCSSNSSFKPIFRFVSTSTQTQTDTGKQTGGKNCNCDLVAYVDHCHWSNSAAVNHVASAAAFASTCTQRVRIFDRARREYVQEISGQKLVSVLLPLLPLTTTTTAPGGGGDDVGFANNTAAANTGSGSVAGAGAGQNNKLKGKVKKGESRSQATRDALSSYAPPSPVVSEGVLTAPPLPPLPPVLLNISAMTFTSSGQYLFIAVSLSPTLATTYPTTSIPLATPTTSHVSSSMSLRVLDAPATGVVVWCCMSQKVVGTLLDVPTLTDVLLLPRPFSSSSFGGTGDSKRNTEAEAKEVTSSEGICTPPRPAIVTTTKPFYSTASDINVGDVAVGDEVLEVDSLVLLHQDTLLATVCSRSNSQGGISRLYTLHWSELCCDNESAAATAAATATTGSTTGSIGAPTRSGTGSDCSSGLKINVDRRNIVNKGISGCGSGSSQVISSCDYFTRLMTSSSCLSSSLCPELCVPVSTTTPYVSVSTPGRRMAALLLHSAQSWINNEPGTKVFVLQGLQGSGKSGHLCQLVESLKNNLFPFTSTQTHGGERGRSSVITGVLPTPTSIISAITTPSSDPLSLPRVSTASYAEIAFDLVLSLARQLRNSLGDRYTSAMLKGLASELTTFYNMRQKTVTATSGANIGVNVGGVSGDPPLPHPFARTASHLRNFSAAGVEIEREMQLNGVIDQLEEEGGCSGEGVANTASSAGSSTFESPGSECFTPPFLFPPFAFLASHQYEHPHRQQQHLQQHHQQQRTELHQSTSTNSSARGDTSPVRPGVAYDYTTITTSPDGSDNNNSKNSFSTTSEFVHFSDLLCATGQRVLLTARERYLLKQKQKKGPVLVLPHVELLPFLSLSRLFQLLISDPLREIDLNRRDMDLQMIIALDNVDVYDHVDQYNQVQSVMDMLLHCTPSWVRVLVATNSPFTSATRPYLTDNMSTEATTKHFCLHGGGSGGEITYPPHESGYRQDLQESLTCLLRHLLPPPSRIVSSACGDVTDVSIGACADVADAGTERDPAAERGGNAQRIVNISHEQYEDSLDEMQGVLLSVVDGSYQCLQLLQALLSLPIPSFTSSARNTLASTNKISNGHSAPIAVSFIFQTLTMIDFHASCMEGVFAATPRHERKLTKKILEIIAAAFEPSPVKALEDMLIPFATSNAQVHARLLSLSLFVNITSTTAVSVGREEALSMSYKAVQAVTSNTLRYLRHHLSSPVTTRGSNNTISHSNPFKVNILRGHSLITALYLTHSSNKSIAVDHTWQTYLKTYGPSHLHRACRSLHEVTRSIRKIDETSGLKGPLPVQLGYISGLQEIYARRVGIYGPLPASMGCLEQLRVLSMGNNKISGCIPESLGNLHHLQRIVLHQNKLSGVVPKVLARLGCIVNLAGNSLLVHGDDVPSLEKQALLQLFRSTGGFNWVSNVGWEGGTLPVSQWYKVGVLGSNVHSIVMSSNNMVGQLPESIANLQMLRMVELATMPGLRGTLPRGLCQLVNLRRLCICRCGLSGSIPGDISQLSCLEELQLFGNNLSGLIPPSLGDLTNLRLLSLGEYTGGNNFTSATLPSCFSRLRKLEALFMANCHLKGSLPNWIGNLSELRQLDLQRNALAGTIPSGFQHLRSLLYLNLKDNYSLCGPLPVFPLGKLTKLNRLSLVHCGFDDSPDRVVELQEHLLRCRIWI